MDYYDYHLELLPQKDPSKEPNDKDDKEKDEENDQIVTDSVWNQLI